MTSTSLAIDECFEFVRNGMNVRQSKQADGLPVTRIETISDGTINLERVGYAGLEEGAVGKWILEAGDILFSHINSVEHVGKCALYEGSTTPLVHGMNLLCLRPKRDILYPHYAKWILKSGSFRSKILPFINKAVNQASLSTKNLKSIEILLPSLDEQKRIAAILDQADTLRRLRQRAIGRLNTLGQAIFHEMFGDFVNSGAVLGDYCDRVTKGESPKWQGFDYQEAGPIFVTSENVGLGKLLLDKPKHIPQEFHQKLSRSQLSRGDLLVNLVGASIGRACLFASDQDANINQAVAVVSLRNKSQRFLDFTLDYLLSHKGQNYLLGSRVEGARANISLKNIREMPFKFPEDEVLSEYSQRMALLNKNKTAHELAAVKEKSLFVSLQHRAFQGEL